MFFFSFFFFCFFIFFACLFCVLHSTAFQEESFLPSIGISNSENSYSGVPEDRDMLWQSIHGMSEPGSLKDTSMLKQRFAVIRVPPLQFFLEGHVNFFLRVGDKNTIVHSFIMFPSHSFRRYYVSFLMSSVWRRG